MEEILLRLRLDGWCVIENVIPADQVAAVREHVAATVAKHRRHDAPKKVAFLPGLINFDQSFAPYLAEPRLLDPIKALFGPYVRISFTSALINEPGNERGGWHADWPYNQNRAGHIPVPYPDAIMHITTLWMLSPFNTENGGTLVVSGSHRMDNNPTGNMGIDPLKPYPTEIQVTGEAGSVLVMDSRLWHAVAPNRSEEPRVAMAIRYAPWWLNLKVLMPGSVDRVQLTEETGLEENEVPAVPLSVFEKLPADVKPLYEHWVVR